MKKILIPKVGIDAIEASSPNDFVFNTDYNTFKIIKEASHSPTLSTNSSQAFTSINHNLGFTPFLIGFCKFANNRVSLPGNKASNTNFVFTNLRSSATQARFGYINQSGGNYSPVFRYLATEVPLSGTPNIPVGSGSRIIVAKPGFDATIETNPNNIVYDSRYKTLKYFDQGVTSVNVPAGTPAANVPLVHEQTIKTHSLGYYPFHLANIITPTSGTQVYSMPWLFGSGPFMIRFFLYVTTSSMIFRSESVNSIGGISMGGYTLSLRWSIFSYDLGF